MDNSDPYLEMAATEKLRYAVEAKKLANEMAEQLAESLRWLLHYCAKNNIPIPKENIVRLIDRAVELEQNFNLKLGHQPTFDRHKDQPQNGQNLRKGAVKTAVDFVRAELTDQLIVLHSVKV